ncbi:peptidase G1 [Xylaria palmicola]|nr:peptidase G1 [Xylaria palmicola]
MRPPQFAAILACLSSSTVLAGFDQNRAGAVLKAPSDSSFTSVTGTFTVPALTGSSLLSIWVAIGDTLSQDVVLKGGITYNETLSSFAAWYPSPTTDTTPDVPVAAGDSITVTVSVPHGNGTPGTVVLDNTTQKKTSTQTIPIPSNVDSLSSLAADWFVQAYQLAGELVQVPTFGTLSFTNCSASLADGTTIGPEKAGVFEIQGTSGQIFSSTKTASSSVSVQQQSVQNPFK